MAPILGAAAGKAAEILVGGAVNHGCKKAGEWAAKHLGDAASKPK